MEKRKFYQKKRIMIPVIVGLSLIFLGIFGAIFSSFYLATSNAKVDGFQIPVLSKTDGKISKILVENGASIKKGEIIFQLESDVDAKRIEELEKNFQVAQNKLKKFEGELEKNNIRINQTKKNIEEARLNLENANNDYVIYKNEFKDGTVTKKDLDRAIENLEIAQNQYEEAQTMLQKNNEILDEIIVEKNSRLEELKEALEELEEAKIQLSFATITAKKSGIISDISLKEGDEVEQDSKIALITSDECFVLANFKKMYADKLTLGQKVSVKIYTLDFKTLKGEIVEILPENSNLIPVRIKILSEIKNCKIKNNAKAFVRARTK